METSGRRRPQVWLVVYVCLCLVLAACGAPPAAQVPPDPPAPEPTTAPADPTAAPPAAPTDTSSSAAPEATTAPTEAAASPVVGGTFVYVMPAEPPSLDPHKAIGGSFSEIGNLLGASLIAQDPATGELVPYLAESWTASDDGLVWEFKLREDITFQDGTPFTAQDYVWTFERGMDPDNQSAVTAGVLGAMKSATAVDDYTLRLELSKPANLAILNGLKIASYFQPLLGARVDELGDDYGRNPLSVGPFTFNEWRTGDRIIATRNPEYSWAPEFTGGAGPTYIENIEFRFIPDEGTRLVAMEAGEVDFGPISAKDLARVEATGQYNVIDTLFRGAGVLLQMNVSKPPFDDLRVRQALSFAVDRDVLVRVVTDNNAVATYGPLTPNSIGYWAGVEEAGYRFNLDRARSLLAEAGYTTNSSGVLEKDGVPLSFNLQAYSAQPEQAQIAEILQQQLTALGMQVELSQVEDGIANENLTNGNFDVAVTMWGWPDPTALMRWMYHSENIDSLNWGRVNDPELDKLLDAAVSGATAEVQLQALEDVQRYVVENAYVVPVYTPKRYFVLNKRVQGAAFDDAPVHLYLDNAYIEDGR